MKTIVARTPATLDRLELVEKPQPQPGPGEICVRLRASSLNYHDYAVVTGMLPVAEDRVPMSDGAGEVVSIGAGVTDFSVGDAVMTVFFPKWQSGKETEARLSGVPGDHIDGYAAEYACRHESAFTRIPAGYSMEEAATLPCAALTAWRALFVENKIGPDSWVLTMGSGGVSVFALQLAKSVGARVIATSSSAEKMERLKELGADHVINYRETPEWGDEVKRLTGGVGVDEVVEVGGPNTLAQSINACRLGGHITLIGVLTGFAGEVPTAAIMFKNLRISGVMVGSKDHQLDLIQALESTGIRPVIDSTYPLEKIADAFRHQESQQHFGKICLTM